MAITYTPISPEDGDLNVDLNTEIVFGLVSSSGAINLASIQTEITINGVSEKAIENGVFVNDYTGEIIDNSSGSLTDITIVVIRPTEKPEYQQGIIVTVGLDAS